jgi:hypothetical protein
MELTCLYYTIKGYKAIYYLEPQNREFRANGCAKGNTGFGLVFKSATVREFSFNETDRRKKIFLIDFGTIKLI